MSELCVVDQCTLVGDHWFNVNETAEVFKLVAKSSRLPVPPMPGPEPSELNDAHWLIDLINHWIIDLFNHWLIDLLNH